MCEEEEEEDIDVGCGGVMAETLEIKEAFANLSGVG